MIRSSNPTKTLISRRDRFNQPPPLEADRNECLENQTGIRKNGDACVPWTRTWSGTVLRDERGCRARNGVRLRHSVDCGPICLALTAEYHPMTDHLMLFSAAPALLSSRSLQHLAVAIHHPPLAASKLPVIRKPATRYRGPRSSPRQTRRADDSMATRLPTWELVTYSC